MAETKPTVCVIGLGYIGLPTASILATNGLEVRGVDVNEAVLEKLRSGSIHIEEPGLKAMVAGSVASGRLTLHASPPESDVFILAVPTPTGDDFGMDPKYVVAATRSILPVLKEGDLVILESTVRPGTSDEIVLPILEEAGFVPGETVFYAHCPERVMPGKILREFIQNHRIIGANDARSAELAKRVYEVAVEGSLRVTSAVSAELCKLYENTYRDVNIALANEAAWVCEELGADVHDVIRLSNLHPRVHLHQPGPGVGGHCISVDPYFIAKRVPETAQLVTLARRINSEQPKKVTEKALKLLGDDPQGHVAVLGVTYKGDVDDCRETPAKDVLDGLEAAGVPFKIHDPFGGTFERDCVSISEAFDGAALALLLTDHSDFRFLDAAALAEAMRSPVLFDTRNFFDVDRWRDAGFAVHRLGVRAPTA